MSKFIHMQNTLSDHLFNIDHIIDLMVLHTFNGDSYNLLTLHQEPIEISKEVYEMIKLQLKELL